MVQPPLVCAAGSSKTQPFFGTEPVTAQAARGQACHDVVARMPTQAPARDHRAQPPRAGTLRPRGL